MNISIKLEQTTTSEMAFNFYEGDHKVGEMVVTIDDGKLTVYHTEVMSGNEGKGYAKQLLDAMVAHARENQLKVVALCPYVHAQFSRHPDAYADIWERSA